ncbi:M15 family metallopeptidase [uncultured Shewanella sp.]|uniref:M15 family metallopeptidase n=1 Tax=uncultured Shewanella sp. TaxID=173975 RepID=UPI0026238962|nr:M15 family metallopeptidase [uncultured Shewanella sp.]
MLRSHKVLLGLSQEHLKPFGNGLLEANTLAAFMRMQKAAKRDGIHITPCSTFRDFHAQQAIWDQKAKGRRPLLDHRNHVVNIQGKTDNELIDLILLWSALPGTSRHHWGTDLDVFDSLAITAKQLQLIDSEYHETGPCHSLSKWLDAHAKDYGFYRPYQAGLSGVSPEPWHLSYYPIAKDLLAQFELEHLTHMIKQSNIQLKQALLPRLKPLVQEYVLRVAPPPE